MREASKKILLGFLAVAIIAPTMLFLRPQKAEALVSLAACFAAKKVTAGIALAKIAPSLFTNVNVISPAEANIAAEGPAGTDWRSCFLGSLAKIIAKTILHTFTQSIVNWINTGFEGSPSFVTNPEGFLNDIADQTIGRVIEDISPLLCSPFRLDIRFALGLNLSVNNKEIHCRLSDVMANVRGAYDGFVGGKIGSGNLSNWIHIAGTPQNNPYGAYLATTNKLSIGITSATAGKVKEWDWGRGFMSWRSCEVPGPNIVVAGRVTRKGPCKKEGPLKTPGSVIQDQATGALGTTLRELELAQEIDEVVGALINQLLVKAMTGVGGLLGASKGDITNGGESYASTLLTDPNRAISGADAQTPIGINCDLRYYPATRETTSGSKIYVADDRANGSNQVWTDNLGFERTLGAMSTEDHRPIVEAKYGTRTSSTFITKNPGQSWVNYFATVRAGCENKWNTTITNASTEALASYGGGSGGGGSVVTPPQPPKPPTNTNREISLATAGLNQSHIYFENNFGRGPQNAIYGSGLTDTAGSAVGHWWTASLSQTERIKMIKIKSLPSSSMINSLLLTLATIPAQNEKGGIPITPTDVTGYIVYSYPSMTANATVSKTVNDLTITFSQPIEANAIVISDPSRVLLTEVKLYRPAETSDDSPAPEIAFAFATSSPESSYMMNIPKKESAFLWSGLSFTPNKPRDGVKFRAKFYTCDTTFPCVFKAGSENFTNHFTSLHFNYTVNNNQTTKTAIEKPAPGEVAVYNRDQETGITETGNPSSVIFTENLSVRANSPITMSVDGVLGTEIPFRIVIEALDGNNVPLASITGDFIK